MSPEVGFVPSCVIRNIPKNGPQRADTQECENAFCRRERRYQRLLVGSILRCSRFSGQQQESFQYPFAREQEAKPLPTAPSASSFVTFGFFEQAQHGKQRDGLKPIRSQFFMGTIQIGVAVRRIPYGNASNQTLLLQCYTGEDFTKNRVSSDPLELVNPLLSIAAGTQPCVVEQLLSDDEFVRRGGAGRFLIVTPHSTFGDRPYESPPVPASVWEAYVTLIETLGALPMNRHEPQRLVLADDARPLISDFFIETDRKLERCSHDPKMSGLLGKLPGTTNRIAGILHAARYADENAGLGRPVSAETMPDAIELARFFAAHAEVAMSSAKSGMALQEVLWEKILELKLEHFRASGLWQMLKGSEHFKVMDDLKKPLEGLADRHYLLPCPVVDTGARGRKPSPKYRVNPRALALDDDNDDQF